jgi:hypothetical protein
MALQCKVFDFKPFFAKEHGDPHAAPSATFHFALAVVKA